MLESHANVKDLPLLEAKLQYIKTWQNLPDYGQTLFVVRFMGHRKDEIISIANNRIMRLDPNTGDHIKTWRYSTMKVCIVIVTCYVKIIIYIYIFVQFNV